MFVIFVILPSECNLYISDLVQECFKIMLRKLKESKGGLLKEKQDEKGEREKRQTRTCQKAEV